MEDEDFSGSGYGGNTPYSEDKATTHTFLQNVAKAKDTTKLGFLSDQEIGIPGLTLRGYKDLETFCRRVLDQPTFADYFKEKAENVTSTSLSRDAKLINLAVIQKKEVADVTPAQKKENKGWFKPKDSGYQPPKM